MKLASIISLSGVFLAGCSVFTTPVKQQDYDIKGNASYVGVKHLSVDSVLVELDGIDMPYPSQQCLSKAGAIYDCGKEARSELIKLTSGHVGCIYSVRNPAPQAKLLARKAKCYSDGIDMAEHLIENGFALASGPAYSNSQVFANKHLLGLHQGRYMLPSDYSKFLDVGRNGNHALFHGEYSLPEVRTRAACDIALVNGAKYKLYLLPGDKFYDDVAAKSDTQFACSQQEALKLGYKRQ